MSRAISNAVAILVTALVVLLIGLVCMDVLAAGRWGGGETIRPLAVDATLSMYDMTGGNARGGGSQDFQTLRDDANDVVEGCYSAAIASTEVHIGSDATAPCWDPQANDYHWSGTGIFVAGAREVTTADGAGAIAILGSEYVTLDQGTSATDAPWLGIVGSSINIVDAYNSTSSAHSYFFTLMGNNTISMGDGRHLTAIGNASSGLSGATVVEGHGTTMIGNLFGGNSFQIGQDPGDSSVDSGELGATLIGSDMHSGTAKTTNFTGLRSFGAGFTNDGNTGQWLDATAPANVYLGVRLTGSGEYTFSGGGQGLVAATILDSPQGATNLLGNESMMLAGAQRASGNRSVAMGHDASATADGAFVLKDSDGTRANSTADSLEIDFDAGTTIVGGLTIGDSGTAISKTVRASAATDIASVAAQTCLDTEVTLVGSVTGAECSIGLPAAPTANLSFTCYINATGKAKIRACNPTGGAIDPASATYSVRAWNP